MAKTYDVTLYYSTGFNGFDIPDGPEILNQATKRNFPAVFKRQSRGLGSIKLAATYADVEDADYCSIGSDYYYILDVNMATNDTTATLTIKHDPITSMGGVAALNIIGGWLLRAHAKDDKPFSNTLPEDFVPRRPLKIISKTLVHKKEDETRQGYLTVVASSVDLTQTVQYAKKLVIQPKEGEDADATSDYMLYPELPPANTRTTTVTYGGSSYELPSISLFNLNGGGAGWVGPPVIEAMKAVRETGIENAISAMYVIPVRDVTMEYHTREGSTQRYATIKSIAGKSQTYKGDAYAYGQVKNRKALDLWNTYTIIAIASNDAATFDAAELYSGGTQPDFVVDIDPSPNGSATMRPTYYQGKETLLSEHCVETMPWLAAGYAYEGGSGSLLTMANANRNIGFAKRLGMNSMDSMAGNAKSQMISTAVDIAGGLVGAGSQVPGAVHSAEWGAMDFNDFGGEVNYNRMLRGQGSVLGAIGGAVTGTINGLVNYGNRVNQYELGVDRVVQQTAQTVNNQLFDATKAANVVAPDIQYPVQVNGAAYFGGTFALIHIGLDPADLADFDARLTANGQKTDEPYYAGCMTDRTAFNCVQFDRIQLGNAVSMSLRRAAEEVLMRGVRIWHKLADKADYTNNPRRTT